MKYPSSIQNLIDHFTQLPTVGPKTAERYVFYLLKQSPENLNDLARKIAELKQKTTICQSCLSIAETSPCHICADTNRKKELICVVANTQDMMTIESTNYFKGNYYVLGATISAVEGVSPDKLNIKGLLNKIKQNQVKEIILALPPTLEGETTVMYLAKVLKPYDLNITKLARGLPTGADLEYTDETTMSNALKYRNKI